jgi:hypothetical protein
MGEFATNGVIGKDSSNICITNILSTSFSYCGRGYCKKTGNTCVLLDKVSNLGRHPITSVCQSNLALTATMCGPTLCRTSADKCIYESDTFPGKEIYSHLC